MIIYFLADKHTERSQLLGLALALSEGRRRDTVGRVFDRLKRFRAVPSSRPDGRGFAFRDITPGSAHSEDGGR
ncbi:hypothetical protein ACQEU3_43110 [Spirillospora sp. CA-253888]